MKYALTDLLHSIIGEEFGDIPTEVIVTRPEMASHGDYSTNVAMVLSKPIKKSPREIAIKIQDAIMRQKKAIESRDDDQNTNKNNQTLSSFSRELSKNDVLQAIDHIEIDGPGFINIFLSEASLSTLASEVLNRVLGVKSSSGKLIEKQKSRIVMVEFAHPNTHKAFHIGHLRNITTGESVVRLLAANGETVVRANYQGDVGLHIAKSLYGILHHPDYEDIVSKLTDLHEKIDFLSKAYVVGNSAYESTENENAKREIEAINKKIYARDPTIFPLYEQTRKWSLEYFDAIYKRVGSHFDRLYFESETYELGKKTVLEGVEKGIFVNDGGTVIFPGEKFGLHNRVFITREGNPTYEAKDMGLGKLQFGEYHPDLIIHCVSSEQTGYFQVIIEALAQLEPQTRGKEYHLVYGWVRLKEGKMSSRTGNVVLGEWLLDEVKKAINNKVLSNISIDDRSTSEKQPKKPTMTDDVAEAAAIAAVKYSFLRVSTQQDIAFDINESININGDSGVYLLYSYARCRSVIRKSGTDTFSLAVPSQLATIEREIMRLLSYYPQVVKESADIYQPSKLCSYLFDLAQAFNLFYATCPILETEDTDKTISTFRLGLTNAVSHILQHGLSLLGIATIEHM